ncbi:hypothetical protein [Asticcacaulis sp.]|uniref:hypothetical protein n=1 Tax=Asticcacaulis sp. TaxID=1872648 RepID=UPI003F7B6F73
MYEHLSEIEPNIISKNLILRDGGHLVFLDYAKVPHIRGGITNLLRFNAVGLRMWAAEAIEHGDVFTSMELNGETIHAFTWSCFSVVIDLDSGRIRSRIFTK